MFTRYGKRIQETILRLDSHSWKTEECIDVKN